MKLVTLLTITCCSMFTVQCQTTRSNEDDLLKRASAQLERLAPYRRIIDREKVESVNQNEEVLRTNAASAVKSEKERLAALEILQIMPDDLLRQLGASKRIDDNSVTIDFVTDPKYAAMIQERIKRSGGSLFSGIASGVVSGIASASKGSSHKEHTGYSEHYEHYHTYEDKKFDVWDFKKAIFNTLFQALKAISGGVIALKGHLIKGGGYLVSAKGKIISKTGEAISTLGKHIASSAVVSSKHPSYDHTGYTYEHPGDHYGHDHSYDGPPPSATDYSAPTGGGYGGHASYGAPSDDTDHAGLLIMKPVEHSNGHDEHVSGPEHEHDHLPELEASYGDEKKPHHFIKGLLSSIPLEEHEHKPPSHENHVDYPTYDHPPPDYNSHGQDYPIYPPLQDPRNTNGNNNGGSNHLAQQNNGHPQTNDSNGHGNNSQGQSSGSSKDVPFYSGLLQLDPFKITTTIDHQSNLDLLKLQPQLNFPDSPSLPTISSGLTATQPLRIPILNPLPPQYWGQGFQLPASYNFRGFLRKSSPKRRRFVGEDTRRRFFL